MTQSRHQAHHEEPPSLPREAGVLVLCGLLAVAVVFPGLVAGTAIPVSTEFTGVSDLLDEALPLQRWVATTFLGGHLPLWYPGCYGGLPASGIAEAVPFYPPAIVPHLLFGQVRAVAWTLAAHLLIAGVGAGLLARSLGANRWGAALATIAASCGLWLPDHFRQVNLLLSAAWVPWAWLMLELWLRKPSRRRTALLALAFGVLGRAGHLQVLHHTLLVLGVYALARLPFLPRLPVVRRTASLALAATLAVAMAGPHAWPTWQAARLARGSSAVVDSFPGQPRFLATLIAPRLFGSPADDSVQGNVIYWEEAQYVGLLTLVLALAWLAASLRERASRRVALPLAAVVGVSLWFAYGRSTGLFYIPGGGQLRFLQRHLWFVTLALSVSAGLSLRLLPGRLRTWPVLSLLVLLLLLDLRLNVRPLCPVASPGPLLREPRSSRLLKKAGARPSSPGERIAFLSMGTNAGYEAWKAAGPWSGDLQPYAEYRELLLPQHANLWGWNSVQGHVGLAPRQARLSVYDQHEGGLFAVLQNYATESQHPDILGKLVSWAGFLGARWVLSPERLSADGLVPVGEVAGERLTVHLYRNDTWAGVAWVCHKVLRVENDEAALKALLVSREDYRNFVVTTEDLPAVAPVDSRPSGESVRVVSASDTSLELDATLQSPGYLVTNLAPAPGWNVTVDGVAQGSLHVVNLARTAVHLPAGTHRVQLRYGSGPDLARLVAGTLAGLVSLLMILMPRTGSPTDAPHHR